MLHDPVQRVQSDFERTGVVLREFTRPHKRDLRAIFAANGGDLLVVRRKHHPIEFHTAKRGLDSPRDHRFARDECDVFARDAFRSTPGGNESKDLHGRVHVTLK